MGRGHGAARELWDVNQAVTKHSLAAFIKSVLELQGFSVGAPLVSQAALDDAGREEPRRILEGKGVLPRP